MVAVFWQEKLFFFSSGLFSSIRARSYSFQFKNFLQRLSSRPKGEITRETPQRLAILMGISSAISPFGRNDKNEIQLTKEKNPLKSASSACQYQQHFHIPYFTSHISPKKLLNKSNAFRMHNSFTAIFIIAY